jgi:hypothetical protein
MSKRNLKSGRASGKIPLGERIQVVVTYWGEPPEVTRRRFYEIRKKLAEIYGATEAEIDRDVLFVGLLNLGGKDNFAFTDCQVASGNGRRE